MYRTLLASLLLLSASSGAATAQGWQRLGEANVDGSRDHDEISVNQGPFRSIRMLVEVAPIHFDHIQINYSNGTSGPIGVARRLNAGQYTREIMMPGGRRDVRSVEFWYARAVPNSAKPKVVLFGRR
jgi:hypothetical protein